MATRATSTVQALADEWERLYPSAVFSGIVGNTDHAQRGGYHISVEDQVDPDNYSVVRPDDKAPPGTWPRDCAAAIDMNLALDDMKLCHGRLVAVWRARAVDPRGKYINGHNGWDGNDGAGRYDWVTGSVSSASDDHKWHIHLELRRRYVNSAEAARAVLSILRGETLAQYLGDDMDLTAQNLTDIARAVANQKLGSSEITIGQALQTTAALAAKSAAAGDTLVKNIISDDQEYQELVKQINAQALPTAQAVLAALGSDVISVRDAATALIGAMGVEKAKAVGEILASAS